MRVVSVRRRQPMYNLSASRIAVSAAAAAARRWRTADADVTPLPHIEQRDAGDILIQRRNESARQQLLQATVPRFQLTFHFYETTAVQLIPSTLDWLE